MTKHPLLLLILFNLVVVSTCTKCEKNCGNGGLCIDNKCRCYQGFFDDNEDDEFSTCNKTIRDYYPASIIAFRAIFSTGYFGLVFLSAVGLWVNRGASDVHRDAYVINIRKIILSATMIISFVNGIMYALDFFSTYGVIRPIIIYYLLDGVIYPTLLLIYASILLHWIELYNTSVQSIKREEMLQKINSQYNSEVTVEDILNKVKFLKKLKIPFYIIVILGYMITITREVWRAYGALKFDFVYVFGVYFFIIWVVLNFGFNFYGRKLIGLLPPKLGKRMQRTTIILTVFGTIGAAGWVIVIILESIFGNNRVFWVIEQYIINSLMCSGLFSLLFIAMKFSTSFPFCFDAKSRSLSASKSAASSTKDIALTEATSQENL